MDNRRKGRIRRLIDGDVLDSPPPSAYLPHAFGTQARRLLAGATEGRSTVH